MSKQLSVSKQGRVDMDLDSLMKMLSNNDGMTRKKARKTLVALGKPAVPFLTRTLRNSKLDHLRWEAAKALGSIGDARAIPSLVKSLEDSDQDVAWLAAEALIKFKKVDLEGIIKSTD